MAAGASRSSAPSHFQAIDGGALACFHRVDLRSIHGSSTLTCADRTSACIAVMASTLRGGVAVAEALE